MSPEEHPSILSLLSDGDLVPGMGLGASAQAIRWARLGRLIEALVVFMYSQKNKRGRPSKDPIQSKDAHRAYCLWLIANRLNMKNRSQMELIEVARQVEELLNFSLDDRAFPTGGKFESSVSRGRKILKIDKEWKSEVCDKLAAI